MVPAIGGQSYVLDALSCLSSGGGLRRSPEALLLLAIKSAWYG